MQCANSPHFEYGCSSWFPLLKKKLKTELQKDENKYIRFCLNLPCMSDRSQRSRIDPPHLRKIKRYPPSDRVERCIANTVFTVILLRAENRVKINPSSKNVKQGLLSCIHA